MDKQDKLEDLTVNINRYLKINIDLIKLEATEQSSVIGSILISNIIMLLVTFLLILFASIGAGFYISDYYANNYSGFIVVAGVYFLIALVVLLIKRNFIEKLIRDKIIYKMLSKKIIK